METTGMAIDEKKGGREQKGGRSMGRSGGELPRGEEYGRLTSAPPLPSPNPTPLLRGFRWSFYHPADCSYMDSLAVN